MRTTPGADGAHITSADGGGQVFGQAVIVPIPSLAGRSSKIVHITMTHTGPPGSSVPSAGAAFSLVQKDPTPADNVATAKVTIT
jgi:hypothetical protein